MRTALLAIAGTVLSYASGLQIIEAREPGITTFYRFSDGQISDFCPCLTTANPVSGLSGLGPAAIVPLAGQATVNVGTGTAPASRPLDGTNTGSGSQPNQVVPANSANNGAVQVAVNVNVVVSTFLAILTQTNAGIVTTVTQTSTFTTTITSSATVNPTSSTMGGGAGIRPASSSSSTPMMSYGNSTSQNLASSTTSLSTISSTSLTSSTSIIASSTASASYAMCDSRDPCLQNAQANPGSCSSIFQVFVSPAVITRATTSSSSTTTTRSFSTSTTITDTVLLLSSTETTSTLTTIITSSATITTRSNRPVQKRQVTISPSQSAYNAPACTNFAAYSSACSCLGFIQSTSTLVADVSTSYANTLVNFRSDVTSTSTATEYSTVFTSTQTIKTSTTTSSTSSVTSSQSPVASNVAVFVASIPESGADVQTMLRNTNRFLNVDLFDASSSTPTLAQLLVYDAVLVFSDFQFADPDTLGNNLADYIDAGYRVVVATFVFNDDGLQIGGRYGTGAYSPYTLADQTDGDRLSLVKVLPADPLLNGVNTFNGGTSSYREFVSLTSSAVLVASWTSGLPLIARKRSPTNSAVVVGLNFFPASDKVRADLWDSTTDGATILANALQAELGNL